MGLAGQDAPESRQRAAKVNKAEFYIDRARECKLFLQASYPSKPLMSNQAINELKILMANARTSSRKRSLLSFVETSSWRRNGPRITSLPVPQPWSGSHRSSYGYNILLSQRLWSGYCFNRR